MTKLHSKYILCRAGKYDKFIKRYRSAKKENEIDAKLAKKLVLKPIKRNINKLKHFFAQIAYPELRTEQYTQPNVDIHDEQRTQKLIQEFFEAGEIRVEIINSDNEQEGVENGK